MRNRRIAEYFGTFVGIVLLMIKIDLLTNHPDLIPKIAEWQFHEWGDLHQNDSIRRRIEKLRAHFNDTHIPLTFISLDGPKPVGTAEIVIHDLPARKDLSPWLASVYVVPEYRNKGIGSALINTAVQKAKELNIPILYLFTWTQESLYKKLGWKVEERTKGFNKDIVIMSIQPHV